MYVYCLDRGNGGNFWTFFFLYGELVLFIGSFLGWNKEKRLGGRLLIYVHIFYVFPCCARAYIIYPYSFRDSDCHILGRKDRYNVVLKSYQKLDIKGFRFR